MFLKHRQAGVTLAEVLVSMAVLLIGIFAVIRVFPAGLNTLETSTARAIGVRLTQQRLDVLQNQPLITDALMGLRQHLLMPDAVVFVALDTNNNPPTILYLNDIQPDMLPEERVNRPTGCPAIDPFDPLCNSMTTWKRVIGETHVVQAMTAMDTMTNPPTPFTFTGVVLGHAPLYFEPPPMMGPPDVLNPIFYMETPVSPTIDSAMGRLLFPASEAGSTFKVSYRWLDQNNVMRGVSEETFVLPAAGVLGQPAEYTVAAATGNTGVTGTWLSFAQGSVRVVKVVPVPGEPIMRTPGGTALYRTDSVGLVRINASPGTVIKVNYTMHVISGGSGTYLPGWRSVVEEFKLQPDNQRPQGTNFCAQGKAQLLFKNMDDTVKAFFLRREGGRVAMAFDTTNAPGIPGAELRTGVSQVLLDPSDPTDATLLFGFLSNNACPAPPAIQPTVRAVLESLHDWSNWTEVAAKTYFPRCARDPGNAALCLAVGQEPQDYRQYIEDMGAGLIFQPSEVGKTVAVDYTWLNTGFSPPRIETVIGEVHTISDRSGKFGFDLQHRFLSILEVRGLSVKAHVSWLSANKHRQVITSGSRVPPQGTE